MKRTISVMVGKGSVRHNNRSFTAENVDAERTKNNIVYCNENIRDVYHQLFDEAVEKYNAKKARKDRMISDYYEKIRTSRQQKPFHEVILQIGNKDDMNASSENGQLAKTILDKYMRGFQKRNPNLRVFSAHLHMDEATPHLHIDFVPFAAGGKNGLETKVSLKKALAEQGFVSRGKRDTEWNRWVESEKEKLSEIMLEHGIEWDKLGTHNKHKPTDIYKRDMLAEEVEQLEVEKDLLEKQISTYKQAEDYALATAQKYESECELPEPPPLITAKNYKKKYADPLFKKLVNTIKTLARKVRELSGKIKLLEQQVKELTGEINKLKSLKWDYQTENAKMKSELRKFDKIKSYLGVDKVEEMLKSIKKSRQKTKNSERSDMTV